MAGGVRAMLEDVHRRPVPRDPVGAGGQPGDVVPEAVQEHIVGDSEPLRVDPVRQPSSCGVRGECGGPVVRCSQRRVPEQVVPVRMGREPRDDRAPCALEVVGETADLALVDSRVDDERPRLPHDDHRVGMTPRAGVDEHPLSHFAQHAPNLPRPASLGPDGPGIHADTVIA